MKQAVKRVDCSLLVILGGISAALHIGKLPPALPMLQESLGLSLVQAGFLLSLVQLAGMTLGLAVGLAADSLGLKRTMVGGLLLLSAASLGGGFASDASGLLVLRALEGLGFLLASMPAPGLIRRLVSVQRLPISLGLWGTYMPLGTAVALLIGPQVIRIAGWPAWWWLVSAASLLMGLVLKFVLPADHSGGKAGTAADGWKIRLRATVSCRGPWLVALSFAVYSGQWLAVIGFLPSIYARSGMAGGTVGMAVALGAAVNILGNVASGPLLQRGVAPWRLLYLGHGAMGLAGLLIFVPLASWTNEHLAIIVQYGAVLGFSMVGGLVPGTLFSLAVRLAPDPGTVSTTVGWMQQWSSLGQFLGPPSVAWLATATGGWQWSWAITGSCAVLGLVLARVIAATIPPCRGPKIKFTGSGEL